MSDMIPGTVSGRRGAALARCDACLENTKSMRRKAQDNSSAAGEPARAFIAGVLPADFSEVLLPVQLG